MNRPSSKDLPTVDVGGEQRDELFDVLSNARRRVTLHLLARANQPLSVAALATEIAQWEADRPQSDQPAGDRSTIEIALVHVHLPQMAQAGVVRYDAANRTATLGASADEVRTHLRVAAST